VRPLRSRLAARQRIAELVQRERHEHLAINPEPVITSDAARVGTPQDRELLSRGIRVRALALPPPDGDLSSEYAVGLAGLGGEHREADALPMKLMVFDRTLALLAADPEDFDAGAIELSDPLAVQDLTMLFHRIWAEARDPARQGVPPIVLTARERAIVSLLALGCTEEFAAVQLGLSRRTVLYALRALMDRLGVENRFQLALVLGAARAVELPVPYRKEVAAACSGT
jgi:DNA-binding CsgD family transcriptional regulator